MEPEQRLINKALTGRDGSRLDAGQLVLAMRQAVGAQIALVSSIDSDLSMLETFLRRLRDEKSEPGMSDLVSRIELITHRLDSRAHYEFDEGEWAEATRLLRESDDVASSAGEELLASIYRRSCRALEMREWAEIEIERIITWVEPSLRSFLGQEMSNDAKLMRLASMWYGLRRHVDQAAGELDGTTYFRRETGSFISTGGKSSVMSLHELAGLLSLTASNYLVAKSAEYELASLWRQLSESEPAFLSVSRGGGVDDVTDFVDRAVERASSYDVLSVSEKLRASWIGDYDELIADAFAGGRKAFDSHAQLERRISSFEKEIDGVHVLLDLQRAFVVAMRIGGNDVDLDPEKQQDLARRRSAFLKWVNDPETDPGVIGIFKMLEDYDRVPNSHIWSWIKENIADPAVLEKIESEPDMIVPSWARQIADSLDFPRVDHVYGVDEHNVVSAHEAAVSAARVRETDDDRQSIAQLLGFIGALRDVAEKDGIAALQFRALTGSTPVVLPMEQTKKLASFYVASVPGIERPGEQYLDAIVGWTSSNAPAEDMVADIERIAYRGELPTWANHNNRMSSGLFRHKPPMLMADIGYLRMVADTEVDRHSGVKEVLDQVQIHLAARLASDPSGGLGQCIAELIAQRELEPESIDTFAQCALAPILIANMAEEGHSIPDSFRQSLETVAERFPFESTLAARRLAVRAAHSREQLFEEHRRLVEIDAAFGLAVEHSNTVIADRLAQLRHDDPDIAATLARTAETRQTHRLLSSIKDISPAERDEATNSSRDDVELNVALDDAEDATRQLGEIRDIRQRMLRVVEALDEADPAGQFKATFLEHHSAVCHLPDAVVTRTLGGGKYASLPLSEIEPPAATARVGEHAVRRRTMRGRALLLSGNDTVAHHRATVDDDPPSLLAGDQTRREIDEMSDVPTLDPGPIREIHGQEGFEGLDL